MTTNATLYVDQGVDFAIALDLFNAEGADFNISDQEFKCEVRKVFSSAKTFDATVVINENDNDLNNIDLIVPAAVTVNVSPGKYQYDIIMTDGVNRVKILEGLMHILPTITSG
jgi:hypothetical protein